MAHDADPDGTVPILSSIAALRMDDDGTPASRYAERGQLGAGGMGEVRLCDDRRTGREVAMKVAHVEALHERFFHEARIQAQLEHPSIVPVYDMGVDRSGAPFFTMKRVRGVTLREVLLKLRKGDPEAKAQYTRRRLLTAFSSVCLALDYAHTRNVVHRDIKPANIMLGEYGEIYVLDWGVARAKGALPDVKIELKLSRRAEDTTPGDIIGTPGYSAPEQMRGSPLDARADVYALGALLFVILALEPLLPADGAVASLLAMLTTLDTRPSQRKRGKDVPPELDAICAKAMALEPDDRYQSARALHDAVDRYLEGDRDVERRRELSAQHAGAAEALARAAAKESDASGEAAQRSRAMVEVNRALALDPENKDGRRVLMRLLTEPPRALPPSAREEIGRSQYTQQQAIARAVSWMFLGGLGFLVVSQLVSGFYNLWYPAISALFSVGAWAVLQRVGRTPYEKAKPSYATVLLATLWISWWSGICGPLFSVPSLIIASSIGFLMQPDRTRRALVIWLNAGAILVPIALQWSGLVPPFYVFEHGRMIVMNRQMDLTAVTVIGIFGTTTLVIMVLLSFFFIRLRDLLTAAEERLQLHAWHLRQLVPH